MSSSRIRSLVYNRVPIGLRFNFDGMVLDADRSSLRRQGVLNINLPSRVELKLLNNEFVSSEDLQGVDVHDISDNEEYLAQLLAIFRASGHRSIFTLQAVHDQSLEVFLADPGWQAKRVENGGLNSNHFLMMQPDGRMWSGGWIGKHHDALKAKKDFHYAQVFWALHRSLDVSDEVLHSYPDLMTVSNTLAAIVASVIIHRHGASFSLRVNNHTVTVHSSTWPDNILDERSFVQSFGLVSTALQPCKTRLLDLSPRELTVMALRKVVKQYLYAPADLQVFSR